MPNIKFNYLYRDSANYKNFGSVVFGNPQNLTIDLLNNTIKSKLIDETWFYATKWNLPNLFFYNFNPGVDSTWHEFESVECTDEVAVVKRTISKFVKDL